MNVRRLVLLLMAEIGDFGMAGGGGEGVISVSRKAH